MPQRKLSDDDAIALVRSKGDVTLAELCRRYGVSETTYYKLRDRFIASGADLKTQRVKGYFLEAAKEIILTEGAESISARKVAEIAGYSYATIYNYFKDIDELLGQTKALMVTDIMKYMRDTMDFTPNNIEDMTRLFAAYTQYYLDHPHIFRFFYFYRLSDAESLKERYDFNAAWASSFRFLIKEGRINENNVEDCAKSILYSVHGLLALYFSGNGLTKASLFADLEKIVSFILRCGK